MVLRQVNLLFIFLLTLGAAPRGRAQVVLTVDEARTRAVTFNRDYLAAGEQVEMAQGDIVKARSGAFPKIYFEGGYNRNLELATMFFEADGETQELKFGFKNNWQAGISVRQPLWEGGKVYTAYKIAREYRDYSEAGARQVGDAVVYNAEILFYTTILQRARLEVLLRAQDAYRHNVTVVEKIFSRGMVSRFELLRARTEEANLKPEILRAESRVRMAEKHLKSFIGMGLGEPVEIVEGQDDTSLIDLPPLDSLIEFALEHRPEMEGANLMVDMRRRAIRVARAGYYPSLAAVTNWSWQSQSDDFSMTENPTQSWTAGLTLSLSVFDGGLTRGEVSQARAEHRQAKLQSAQVIDDVRLETEQAYDNLLQAKKAVDIQGVTIETAEEGLRIANLRYEAGEGTLLEVLSAQTALTQARTGLAETLFLFREARASLKKATTFDPNTDTGI